MEHQLPAPQQAMQPYMLTDAAGRTYPSSAPPTAFAAPVHAPTSMVPACGCSHAPAAPARRSVMSPGAMVAVGGIGVLVVGVVLVALLLSVAVVAAAVATVALSLAVCAMVLRSLAGDSRRAQRGRYRR